MPKDVSKVTYTTSLNSEIVKKFRVYCAKKGKYQNEVLEQLIRELLEKEGEGDGNTDK